MLEVPDMERDMDVSGRLVTLAGVAARRRRRADTELCGLCFASVLGGGLTRSTHLLPGSNIFDASARLLRASSVDVKGVGNIKT